MSTVSAQRREVAKKTALAARLKSIEGQARGIERMPEEDRGCLEIIDQLAALRGATQAVCLRQHSSDQEEALAQMLDVISRLTR